MEPSEIESILEEYKLLKAKEAELAKLGMRFEMVDPKQLKPYKNNNKRHGQKDLAAINASVDAAGFKNVLRVEADYTIIAGHGSDIVAINRDLPLIPVVVCFDLNKTQAQTLRIADNVTSRLSKFNDDVMTAELKEVKIGLDFGDVEGVKFDYLKDTLKLDKWTDNFDVPEFKLDEYEPKPVEELTKSDVSDTPFPTDNFWGIPVLSLKMQATALDLPFVQWGDIARKTKFRGTYHTYAEDDKFEALWKDPTGPVASNCINCVEPNFSNYSDAQRGYVMGLLYKKRWVARYWQEVGIQIFVDMNINSTFLDNDPACPRQGMLGVPPGWRAYCTRGYADHPTKNHSQYAVAVERFDQGTPEQKGRHKDIIFVVYGGGKTIEKVCQENGWIFVRDRRSYQRDEWTKLFNMQNTIKNQ